MNQVIDAKIQVDRIRCADQALLTRRSCVANVSGKIAFFLFSNFFNPGQYLYCPTSSFRVKCQSILVHTIFRACIRKLLSNVNEPVTTLIKFDPALALALVKRTL